MLGLHPVAPGPLAVTLSCLSRGTAAMSPTLTSLPGQRLLATAWRPRVAGFSAVPLPSPWAPACGWNRGHRAEAFSLFLSGAAAPECSFHLPGWPYHGCCFSQCHAPGTSCQAPAHTVRLGPHWLELGQMPRRAGVYPLRQGATPLPMRAHVTLGILKRRVGPGCPAASTCPVPTSQGWSWASSHCVISAALGLGSS